MVQTSESSSIPTLRAALDLLTNDDLKALLNLLPVGRKPTRKGDLIAAIEAHLDGEKLRVLWERLDETQRLAVAETLYSARGLFEAERFQAQYGVEPVFGTKKDSWSYQETPSLLCLFLYRPGRYGGNGRTVPGDLAQRLRRFVPQPAAPALAWVAELPEAFERVDKAYHWQESDQGITLISRKSVYRIPTQPTRVETTTHRLPMMRRDTERDALAEVGIVLRLIDLGRLAVSDKTALPGVAALREIAGGLVGGDFYPSAARESPKLEEIGPIKGFAWPLLMQAGGMAERHGKKLALTKAGQHALDKPVETVRGQALHDRPRCPSRRDPEGPPRVPGGRLGQVR